MMGLTLLRPAAVVIMMACPAQRAAGISRTQDGGGLGARCREAEGQDQERERERREGGRAEDECCWTASGDLGILDARDQAAAGSSASRTAGNSLALLRVRAF